MKCNEIEHNWDEWVNKKQQELLDQLPRAKTETERLAITLMDFFLGVRICKNCGLLKFVGKGGEK